MNRIIGGFILAIVVLMNALGVDIGIKEDGIAGIVDTIMAFVGVVFLIIGTIQRIIKELKTGKRKWYSVVLAVVSAVNTVKKNNRLEF